VKQSPDFFLAEQIDFLLKGGCIEGCTSNFLTPFHFALDKAACLFVPDEIFSLLHEQNQLTWYNNQVLWVPPKSTSLNDIPIGFNSLYNKSLRLLTAVSSSLWDDVRLIVCSLSQRALEIRISKAQPFILKKDSEYDFLIAFLSENKYENVDIVVDCFQFSIRGAIIDFYPPTSKHPVRVGFYGDDVVLHSFDVHSQTTLESLLDIKIPASSRNDKPITLDSLIKDNFLTFFLNKDSCLFTDADFDKKIPFPFNELTFDGFIKKHRRQYNLLEYNVPTGFLGQNNAWIPPWFLKNQSSEGGRSHSGFHDNNFKFTDLQIGDYVVHQDCGIGLFRGTKILEGNGGSLQELLVLEYFDGGLVSVDINHLHKLSHYANGETDNVVLDSLNKKGLWGKKKRRAKKQAEEVVESLLAAYAMRSEINRPEFTVDTQIESLFINQFPYEETVDQKRAWNEISNDLSGIKPMDRLLCGDVGFGKTELAIRAAFRAVLNGKFVIVLAPTTILAQQLESAFRDRLTSFGVFVNSLSRFKTKKEIRLIKDLWVGGKIDVLIGTHAVLYDDIFLNNIGLIIVDEEHRFGVKQKEMIRAIKHTIDVLSMSATPIPRTLNLALSGIREISTLTTPPKSRLPIETQISYFNDALIKSAIINEKYRDGQLFFVHNDVKTLPNYVSYINRLLPSVSVGVVHGQMPPRQIESEMNRFINKQLDVLICTSIIETGIDIANANTVIINNAHRFGLSQLYQIRGRVGRGIKQAYAYLLLPQGKILKRDAFKRLKAIEENTHLGAGYNISNMDLEIRGAGAVFGYKQSGGGRVGFELYSEYIKEALVKIRTIKVPEILPQDVIINIYNNAIILDEYLPSASIRISFYRRLSSVLDLKNIETIETELINRFGPFPDSVKRLITTWKMKVIASNVGVLAIEKKKSHLALVLCQTYLEPFIENVFKCLPKLAKDVGWEYYFKTQKNENLSIQFNINSNEDISSKVFMFMDKLRAIINT